MGTAQAIDPHGGLIGTADLEAMIAAVDRASGLLDAAVLARKAAREALALADVDMAGVALVEGPRTLVMLGSSGMLGERLRRLRIDLDLGEGFLGSIVGSRLPLTFDLDDPGTGIHTFDPDTGVPLDLLLGPRYGAHLRQRLLEERMVTYIGVPVEANGRLLGLLIAGHRTRRAAPARSRVLLARFARLIAQPLSSARQARDAVTAELTAEREKIAFGLHDTIGQILFGIGARARRARETDGGDPAAMAAALRFVEDETSRAATHLREILRTLATPPADAVAETEVRILTAMFTRRSGVAADVVVSGRARPLPPDMLAVLMATVREGLANVEKHAAARTVVVTLHGDDDATTVVVQDDGRGVPEGFAVPEAPGQGTTLGLASLRRRIERVGGQLVVRRLDEGGTMLRAVL